MELSTTPSVCSWPAVERRKQGPEGPERMCREQSTLRIITTTIMMMLTIIIESNDEDES